MNIDWYKPKKNKPYISVTKYRIGFSESLFKEMGKFKYAKMAYSDGSIMIKPCDEDDECAIRVTRGKAPRIVNRGFIRYLISKGVKIEDKAVKYIAEWNAEDGICLVELKG